MIRVRSTQKFPMVAVVLRDDAADERHQDRHARGGADEVLHGQRHHLGEVAHGRLAAVALPVRVGDEADGGVPREIRRDRAHPIRVERQHRLQPLDGVDDDDARYVEEEHRDRVGRPLHLALLGVWRHAARAIDEPLQPAERLLEHEWLAPRRPAPCTRRRGFTAATRTARKSAICAQPCQLMRTPPA